MRRRFESCPRRHYKVTQMKIKFLDINLEKAYEIVEEHANKKLEAIATKEMQDSEFHKLRGYRNACIDLMSLLVELDKKNDEN